MGDPESAGSDSLITGKAQTNAKSYPYNFYIYDITYFWLDPKVPKAQCLPVVGLPARGRAVELWMRLDSIRYLSSKVYVLSCNVIH
jgi:hypothetical protein